MLTIRKANDRGHANHGWLDTYHTFSFASYQDPEHVRFRSLRVMNEDWVAPGKGFGTHPHRDMEIVTYVLQGALEHRDSMGNGEILRPGEFQRMTAGSGITHSEFNPSDDEPVHLYQIWLTPQALGLEPSYEQKRFDESQRDGRLQLVASPTGTGGSLTIHQDVEIYLANLQSGAQVDYQVRSGRGVWIQVLRGELRIADGTGADTADTPAVMAGDGVAIEAHEVEGGPTLQLQTDSQAEIMLFDMA